MGKRFLRTFPRFINIPLIRIYPVGISNGVNRKFQNTKHKYQISSNYEIQNSKPFLIKAILIY